MNRTARAGATSAPTRSAPTRSAPTRSAPTGGARTGGARIEAAARWLAEQHLARREFTAFPERFAPRDLSQAYAVQDAFVRIKSRACGPARGWKIALSNPSMQAFVGLDAPIAGRLLERQIVREPARTCANHYGRLLVEFEVAVLLGADLGPRAREHTRESVADAIAAVLPALELADDRGADYSGLHAHGLQIAADNAWNEGAVLGQARRDWRTLDLGTIRGTVSVDTQAAGSGFGRDLMGHPLDALAWLANHVRARGLVMRAGEIAILGTLVRTMFPHSGQLLSFDLDGFAPLALSVT
ncbi:MAG: hypothetical protein KJZ83_06090 [Burkholderiaceae bacterium]|nr:hypothetical protein [Burkholderiaceae bacterium]